MASSVTLFSGCASVGFRQVSVAAGYDGESSLPLSGRSVFKPAETRTEFAASGAQVKKVYPEAIEVRNDEIKSWPSGK